MERFNWTVLSSLGHYFADHPDELGSFCGDGILRLQLAYSHLHQRVSVRPRPVQRRAPLTLTDTVECDPLTVKTARDHWAKRIEWLVPRARTRLSKAQERRRRAFEPRRRPLRDVPVPGGGGGGLYPSGADRGRGRLATQATLPDRLLMRHGY